MKKFLFALILLFAPAAHAIPVNEITTPGGLSVWRVEDKTTPALTISFAFRGGTELDPREKQGETALLASMLTQGAGNYSSSAFSQALAEENIALSFSAGRDAITGDLHFLLSHTDKAIELSKLALTDAHFSDADLNRQKAGLMALFSRSMNDPDWRATRLLFQNVYGGTPYAQSSRGTPASLPVISPDDLHNLLAARLVKSRLVIVAVGDASPAEVARITDAIFGALPQGDPVPDLDINLQHVGQTWFNSDTAAPQAVVQFALPGLAPTDSDYPAYLVLNDIVGGGGFRSRLMKELRQKLGATYGIYTSPLPLKRAPILYGQGTVAQNQMESALQLIRAAIAKGADGVVSDDELKASKTYLAGAFTRDLTSSGAIADFVLSARLAGLPADYYDHYADAILKVSADDLKRVGQRLFNPGQLRFAIVAPTAPQQVDKTVADLWAVAP